MTDAQLIHEIAHGNNAAFTELYEMYRSEFICYIRKSYKGNDEEIFDLYQDTCVALWSNITSQRLTVAKLSVSLKTYLFTIGHNKLVDLYRSCSYKFKTQFIENLDYKKDYNSEHQDECSENEYIVRQAVTTMTEPCNSILTLYYWDEKSMKEIADLKEYSSADSAKSQKNKCMNKLKAYIKTLMQ